jgi:hypothetical protein
LTIPPPKPRSKAANSKTEKPDITLFLAQLLKFPVDLVAYGKEFLNCPEPLINDYDLTPQEDKNKSEKQEIDNPKKS